MPRWLIKLTGDAQDLTEFHRVFPRGDAHVVEEGGAFYLTGSEFEAFTDKASGAASDAARMQARATEVIEEMFPVVSLNWRPARKPEVGTIIFREKDDGGRDVIVSVGAGVLRAGVWLRLQATCLNRPARRKPSKCLLLYKRPVG